jgi:hypothetical protein
MFLAPTPSLSLAFPTRWLHHHHHNNNTIPPPLHIIPCCRFTWCAQNQATIAWFHIFDPNPPQKYLKYIYSFLIIIMLIVTFGSMGRGNIFVYILEHY